MQIEDVFRLLNIGLILFWFYYLGHLYRWWASRPQEERMILICFPLLLLAIMYSNGESVAQNVGFGSRTLLFTPVLILCLVSAIRMVRKLKAFDKNRKEDL